MPGYRRADEYFYIDISLDFRALIRANTVSFCTDMIEKRSEIIYGQAPIYSMLDRGFSMNFLPFRWFIRTLDAYLTRKTNFPL